MVDHILFSVVNVGSDELVGGGTVFGTLGGFLLLYVKLVAPFMETRKARTNATVDHILGQRQGLVDAVGSPVGKHSLSENVAQVADAVGGLTGTMKELDAKIDGIGREVSGLDAKVDGLGREISHMRERASDQQNVLSSLISPKKDR